MTTAVVLAAGRGSRIRKAELTPKCLIEIAGRPIAAWALDALRGAGVEKVVFITGCDAERVERGVQKISTPLSLQVVRCEDWRLGNGRSAFTARHATLAAEPFVLMMGDHWVGAEHVAKTIAASSRVPNACVLATCLANADHIDLNDATKVAVAAAGRITAIGKDLDAYDAVDTGVFVMRPIVFDALERALAAGDGSLTGANRLLARDGLLVSAPMGTDTIWWDVDTAEDLRALRAALRRRLPDQAH